MRFMLEFRLYYGWRYLERWQKSMTEMIKRAFY